MKKSDYLWVEKYRPQKIDDVIIPDYLKQEFKGFVKAGNVPNLLLCGSAGIGKTTIAKALASEMGAESIVINGSLARNIDTLRNEVTQFASSLSMFDENTGKKVIIFDEADNLNQSSVQPALRGFMEEFHKSNVFVFTCNYKHRIMEPIHSRCTVIDFNNMSDSKPVLAKEFFVRVKEILELEGIKYENAVVAGVIKKFFPDFRRTLNELQRYSATGSIDVGILQVIDKNSIGQLVEFLSTKNFKALRQWVHDNYSIGVESIIDDLYTDMYQILQPKSMPTAISILNECQKADSYVANKEVNLMASMTELMVECEFKS